MDNQNNMFQHLVLFALRILISHAVLGVNDIENTREDFEAWHKQMQAFKTKYEVSKKDRS